MSPITPMEHFFYLCDLSFYSSSMVNDSLIATDKAGTVHVISPVMTALKSDHFKKDIKFYPIDDVCFTTADMFKGIRVWDRHRGKIVYSYKEDSIRMHTYNEEGCMAAVCEGGAKLYDLRIRYCIGILPLSMCWMAEWGTGKIYCVNDACIAEYDIRNTAGMLSNTRVKEDSSKDGLRNIEGVLDFISIGAGEFCTVNRKDAMYLLKLNGPMETDASRRKCIGSRMVKIDDSKDDFVIGILDGNKMGFYEYKDTWLCKFDEFKNVEWVWFGKNNSYMFVDRKLYFMEGGYEKFRGANR